MNPAGSDSRIQRGDPHLIPHHASGTSPSPANSQRSLAVGRVLARPAVCLASYAVVRPARFPDSRGALTAVPGLQKRACVPARTSCVNFHPRLPGDLA